MSSNILSELKNLHIKYLKTEVPSCVNIPSFNDLNSNNPDVLYFEALKEIAESQNDVEAVPYINSLYNFFENNPLKEDDFDAEIPDDNQSPETSSSSSTSDEDLELGDNEETFQNKYPEVDAEEILSESYRDWIQSIKGKPFYKTIRSYYEFYLANTLNFLDRDFLWKFIKAVSSCLTHLLIEGEQKEEALCLIDKYYDSLIQCLNSVVHASDREDVVSSFQYMVDFLGISKEYTANNDESDSSEDAEN